MCVELVITLPVMTSKVDGADMSLEFGHFVFDERAMEKHLPAAAFKKMQEMIVKGGALDPVLADSVAFGMREWAVEHGAHCFAHWFHPLNEGTAAKFDAFLVLREHLGRGTTSRQLSEFSGKQLVQGEPDGSSFPSGGLRRTSEARGYTAWDYTSPPFVVSDHLTGCLYIPTIFCSIFGLSLDQRTPLLKSENALRDAALRSLRLCQTLMDQFTSPGGQCPACQAKPAETDVFITVGAEQEMFIVDRELYKRRPDLVNCGRVLLGNPPTKGQELSDHYWGKMPARVQRVLAATERRLWTLGVPVVTAHNEVAPAQFELASQYERASVASDHNMLLMQVLGEECEKAGLACLFHEKPFFTYVNGSGKHLNWSLATNTGENLLEPGKSFHHNIRFLFFLAAFLRAAHLHADVLRTAIAVPGNEFRLGGMEAPPAIISVFLGAQLGQIVDDVIQGVRIVSCSRRDSAEKVLDLGIPTTARLTTDSGDRNRTSPLAFVSNRFEFRAVGSSQNCAWPITALNAIVAESLHALCDEVDELVVRSPFLGSDLSPGAAGVEALQQVIRKTLTEHQAVIYNGDCYEDAYVTEMAKKRGLPNVRTTPEALATWDSDKNRRLFSALHVMRVEEVSARGQVWAENYSRVRDIEARTLLRMVQTLVIPAAVQYQGTLAAGIRDCAAVLRPEAPAAEPPLAPQVEQLRRLSGALDRTIEQSEKLSNVLDAVPRVPVPRPPSVDPIRGTLKEGTQVPDASNDLRLALKTAQYYHDEVMTLMEEIRVSCNALEAAVDKAVWPFPTLDELCMFF